MEDLGAVFFVISLISCFITGFIADVVASKKNQKGFWWGFWLSWIGIIIVACMPVDNANNNIQTKSKYEKLEQLAELKKANAITQEEFEQEKQRILNS